MNPLSDIDLTLGTDPQFSDVAAIETRNLARYRLGMRVLARSRPGAAERLGRLCAAGDAELRPLMYDPVLRNAFENDMTFLERGTAEPSGFAALLELGVADVLDGVGPCERLTRPRVQPWPGRGPAWVWTELDPATRADEHVAGRLEDLLAGTMLRESSGHRVVPDADMIAGAGRGAELLAELLPHAGAGVLPHICLAGFLRDEGVDGVVNSIAGGDPIPSAFFMAPERAADPWVAAETLFHEGLHLKLFDVLRTGSLARDPDVLVPIPWRIQPWSLTRVLFALHVYAHLVLFRAAAAQAGPELRGRYGEPPATDFVDMPTPGSQAGENGTFTTSAERAAYLGEQAVRVHGGMLTAEGRRFVRWLLGALEPIEPGIASAATPAVPVGGPAGGSAGGSVGGAEAEPRRLDPRGYRQATPVEAFPLPEQRQLVAVSPSPPRFRWLNGHAWLIYALCDGADLPTLRDRYVRAAGPGAAGGLERGVAELLAAGLIEPASV
ncbi:aKG-HExxH-type peptide beta-hydroxylase [Microtetraspora malaysiensis]|uniref:aKG-HExxH-type peptide beta-hydroxylase n=1 Tax=Microtetraspora malaysiensis TaxID=161358 RepID=UPI003D924D5B